MTRILLVLAVCVAALWLLADSFYHQPQPDVSPPDTRAPGTKAGTGDPPPEQAPPRRVGDISVHSERELELLFDRVEELLDRPRSGSEEPLITLVLHGPEVAFFALENYHRHKQVVDRAAKLAALGAIDVAICQTQMRHLGIATDQVPSFLRQVPYGPGEVERLVREGYVTM
jgi:intracellular sulfur oxidation DsrE/DsrF family protein